MSDMVGVENPNGQSCEGCFFYHGPSIAAAHRAVYYDSSGLCRRNAPNPTRAATWPEGWCGEWRGRKCNHQRPNRCAVCAPVLTGLSGPETTDALSKALAAMRGRDG